MASVLDEKTKMKLMKYFQVKEVVVEENEGIMSEVAKIRILKKS